MDPEQKRDEQRYRQIERALLFADDAARRIAQIAEEIKQGGADPDLVQALESGSEAIRAEHRQMMKRVYFRPPATGTQQELLGSDQPDLLAS